MITRVVFEFSVAGGVFPGLADDVIGRQRRPPPPMPPAMPRRIIADPSKRRAPAFQCWKGTIDPATGCAVEGRGQWEQAPLGDIPSELLMALAGLLAGAPQPGKPMFMETRVDQTEERTSAGFARVRIETLTIKLGHVTGEPFEALPPSRRVPEPGPCTEHAHNYLSGFATCQCGQAARTGDCRGWKTEARGSELPPMAARYNRTASILRPYDSEGGAGMLPQTAQRVVDALEAARTRIADLETARPPGALTREECEQAARNILRPYAQDAALNLPAMAERVVARLKTAGDMIDDIALQLRAAMVPEGEGTVRWSIDQRVRWLTTELAATKQREIWATDALGEVADRLGVIAPGGPEWLKIIRDQCVAKYEAACKAEGLAVDELRMADKTIAKGNVCAHDFYEVCEALDIEPAPNGTFYYPGWSRTMRDVCIKAIGALKETVESQQQRLDAARKSEGLAVDALRTVSEAFQAVREHMGAPFIPSGPGWAEQTRDACAVAFNQVKADLAAAQQRRVATYAHESLIKALGYAPGTVPWARCLELVRETITQRNEARQEAAALASKMFDARKEVEGLRKAQAYERNALHQVARALSVTPEADSTDTMDDCLKAIDRMRQLRMDAEAENRGLREKDSAIAEIVTDVQKSAVMNRAARLDDTLVVAIAEGQAHYSASPHDAIRHATALAFEVRGHRQAELRAVAEREADLSQQAGCNTAVLDMSARSEGTLTDEGAVRLHRHLASCDKCRATDDFGRQAIVDDRNCWQEGRRQAEAALDAIRDHLGIRREDLSSPWVDSAKDRIIRAIDGLKEIDRKAVDSAVAATKETIRVRLVMLAGNPKTAVKETTTWPLESALGAVERAVQRLWDEESCRANRQPSLMLETLVERMLHDLKFLTGQHDSLDRASTEIRKMVGADSMPMTDTVTAVREALSKGASNASIAAAIDRLTASQAEGVALLKRLHGVADLPFQEADTTASNITAAQIRALHNSFCDGTATDAIGRHLCRIALGECCVSTKGQHVPFEHRYPTEDEIADAKRRLASHWNGSRWCSETATPTGQPQG